MAYLGAGQTDKVIRILDAMSLQTVTHENTRWAQDSGCALVKGFQAFFVSNYEQAIIVQSLAGMDASCWIGCCRECAPRLSYRDVPDLIAEHGIHVGPATITRD